MEPDKDTFFLIPYEENARLEFLDDVQIRVGQNHFSVPVRGRVRSKVQSLEILGRFEKDGPRLILVSYSPQTLQFTLPRTQSIRASGSCRTLVTKSY